ncbi:MAG: M14 family zinc carboxypeptidase, partial [Bacteroidota bacterium]
MKTLISALCTLLVVHVSLGAAGAKDKYSSYSKLKILANTPDDIAAMQSQGIDLDHYTGKLGEGIEVVVNQDAIEKLRLLGMPHIVLIGDMDAYHRDRSQSDGPAMAESKWILETNGIRDFRYGSMGGYLTYAEMVLQLDSMRLQYPNLITAKESLGVTEQGRTIWGVEISDNPGVPEPGEAVAYYDALHHAREPQ